MKLKQENLQRGSQHQITSLENSRKRVGVIAKKLTEINLLVPFKLEGEEIVMWAEQLNKLLTNEELKKIPFILDCFKTETMIYDKTIGIQNFFRAVKLVYEEDGQFKIRKPIW